MTQSIELVKGELALAKTELLEKARLYSSIEYSGGFESTWSASDGRRVFGIRQARRLAEGHFVIHSHMTIEKRVYSFVLTIISIHFALSVFGCHKSKNSTAETQKALKSQTGLASFYGSAFYGKKTASGERFDQTDWVAAHPSYPLGTVARVTNLKNNKSSGHWRKLAAETRYFRGLFRFFCQVIRILSLRLNRVTRSFGSFHHQDPINIGENALCARFPQKLAFSRQAGKYLEVLQFV